MIEKKMKVKLSEGLEFGPATMFVQVASKFKSRIYVGRNMFVFALCPYVVLNV